MWKVHAIFADFRWSTRVAWSSPAKFLTSATCHLFKKTRARVRDNCRCSQSWSMLPPSPFRNFAENQQFCTFISPSILHSSISHLALYKHPPPDGPARTSHWHLQPWEASNLDGPCTNLYGNKGVYFVSVLFFVVFCAVLFYLLYSLSLNLFYFTNNNNNNYGAINFVNNNNKIQRNNAT